MFDPHYELDIINTIIHGLRLGRKYTVAGKEGQNPTNNIRLEKDSNYALPDP
jgi:hypothetical protein